MDGSEELEVAGIEDCADGCVRKERWEDLLGDEAPAVGFDGVGEESGGGGSP